MSSKHNSNINAIIIVGNQVQSIIFNRGDVPIGQRCNIKHPSQFALSSFLSISLSKLKQNIYFHGQWGTAHIVPARRRLPQSAPPQSTRWPYHRTHLLSISKSKQNNVFTLMVNYEQPLLSRHGDISIRKRCHIPHHSILLSLTLSLSQSKPKECIYRYVPLSPLSLLLSISRKGRSSGSSTVMPPAWHGHSSLLRISRRRLGEVGSATECSWRTHCLLDTQSRSASCKTKCM